ncbi:MAG TPA: hypothetical protein VEQ17_08365, partial [Steroidobacteraceae bacterium]|nr:hypothetical protein [Steroidobacteraceae bacterium]
MPGQVRIKDHQREQRSFLQRSAAAAAVIAGLAVLLLGRLVLLQIVRYDYYLDQAQGNRTRIEPIPANRGLILDRNGKILAENQPSYQLELVREQLPLAKGKPDIDGTLLGLQQLGIIAADEVNDVRRMIRAHRGFESVPIKLRLSEEQIALFAVHRHEFPGIDIQARSTRYYPYGALAVHALGYVGAISEQDLTRIDRSAYAG